MINAKEATKLSTESKTSEETRIYELMQKYIPMVESFIKNACNDGMFKTVLDYDNFNFNNITANDSYKIYEALQKYLKSLGYDAKFICDRTRLVEHSTFEIIWNVDNG